MSLALWCVLFTLSNPHKNIQVFPQFSDKGTEVETLKGHIASKYIDKVQPRGVWLLIQMILVTFHVLLVWIYQ